MSVCVCVCVCVCPETIETARTRNRLLHGQMLAKLPRIERESEEAGAAKDVRDEVERSGSECRMQRRTV